MQKKSSLGERIPILFMATLLIFPSLILLYYINLYSVNVVFWDEWEMIPFFQKMMNGTLSISDLFAPHNEHRIPFARMIMLILAKFTGYNTRVVTLLNWVLLCFTGVIIFHVYRRQASQRNLIRLLLGFLPVSLLLFSFRNEFILIGFTCHIHLMVLGVVATFSLLEMSRGIDLRFVVSLFCAILASFSFVTGLMVWPTGLIQILVSNRSGWIRVYRIVLWCLVGVITSAAFFHGDTLMSGTAGLYGRMEHILSSPQAAGMYFAALIGAPFSYDPVTAMVFSLVISVIAAITIAQGFKAGLLTRYTVWLSFILFTTLSSVATMIGRVELGFVQALSSRYTPITVLGIIGLFFLALSVSYRSNKKTRFGVHSLLTLILVGLIVGYGVGLQAGQTLKEEREMGAYILKTYPIQSDESIRHYLYPRPAVMRERAGYLKEYRLNVFNEEVIDPSTLAIIEESQTFYAFDSINGRPLPQQDTPLVILSSRQETVTITGWAVDKEANAPATTVFITIDEGLDIPAHYGLERPDVSEHFKNHNFRYSGFMASFSSSILERGAHTISLKIVARTVDGYYYPMEKIELIIE